MPSAPALRGKAPKRTIAIGLSAGVLAVSGIGYAAASQVTDNVNRVDVFSPLTDRASDGGGTNILLVGSDDRGTMTPEERKKLHVGQLDYGRHTDSMMIVHIADDGSVGVVSIPRDSLADIPTYTDPATGHTVSASHQKINAAYDIGGPTLAVETIEKNTGVHIDHYAEINFQGFVSMVDGLGGVPVCMKQPVDDPKSGLNLPAGETTLDGRNALAFVRARSFDPSADLGRMKRQQTFLGSLFNQATSAQVLLNPPRLIGFLKNAAGSITVDNEFSSGEMWGMIGSLRSISPSSMTFQTIPIATAGNDVTWDQAKASELFAKLNSGDALVEQPKGTSAGAQAVTVAPSGVYVQFYNGSNVSGLGSKAQADMKAAGFVTVGVPANAPKQTNGKTIIQYDPRYDTSLKTVQAALPNAEIEEVHNLGKTFKVIVGSDYNGVGAITVEGVTTANPPGTSAASADKPRTAADPICG